MLWLSIKRLDPITAIAEAQLRVSDSWSYPFYITVIMMVPENWSLPDHREYPPTIAGNPPLSITCRPADCQLYPLQQWLAQIEPAYLGHIVFRQFSRSYGWISFTSTHRGYTLNNETFFSSHKAWQFSKAIIQGNNKKSQRWKKLTK